MKSLQSVLANKVLILLVAVLFVLLIVNQIIVYSVNYYLHDATVTFGDESAAKVMNELVRSDSSPKEESY